MLGLTCSLLCRGSSQTVAKVVFRHVQNCHNGRIPPKSLLISFRDPQTRRITACIAEKSGLKRNSSILTSLQRELGQLNWLNGCNSSVCKAKLSPGSNKQFLVVIWQNRVQQSRNFCVASMRIRPLESVCSAEFRSCGCSCCGSARLGEMEGHMHADVHFGRNFRGMHSTIIWQGYSLWHVR